MTLNWKSLNNNGYSSGPEHPAVAPAQPQGKPDRILQFVLDHLGSPTSLLEIGAGAGKWTIPLSRRVIRLTAWENSPRLADCLRQNIAVSGRGNIRVVEAGPASRHDVVVASYESPYSQNFPDFVAAAAALARSGGFLRLGWLTPGGLISDIHQTLTGAPLDSPDAFTAFSLFYSLGMRVNLRIYENRGHWSDATLADAFRRTCRYLRWDESAVSHRLILDQLRSGLERAGNPTSENNAPLKSASLNSYIWPDSLNSALLWW